MGLTGLSDPDLDRWTVELRKVAALTGEAARQATDVLLWSIGEALGRATPGDSVPLGAQDGPEALDDAAYSRWMVTEDIGRLRDTIARLRGAQAGGVLMAWDADTLRRQAANVGHLAGPEARTTMAAEIAGVQADANALASELDVTIQRQALRAAGSKVITTAASLPGIIGGIDRAVAELRRLGALTAEDEAAAEQGKRRAVRYRSDKKMEEAEVAAAGGNLRKAERLRAEAGVMLRQDSQRAGLADSP